MILNNTTLEDLSGTESVDWNAVAESLANTLRESSLGEYYYVSKTC